MTILFIRYGENSETQKSFCDLSKICTIWFHHRVLHKKINGAGPRTKPTKRPVLPAKTQISLGIHPVWSDFTFALWLAKDPNYLQADSEYSDQIPKLIRVSLGAQVILLVLLWSSLISVDLDQNSSDLSVQKIYIITKCSRGTVNNIWTAPICFYCVCISFHLKKLVFYSLTGYKENIILPLNILEILNH